MDDDDIAMSNQEVSAQSQADRKVLTDDDIPLDAGLRLAKIAPDVARLILGEPKVQKTNEWRWNNKGSLVFNLETGQFYDFEEGIGGGVKWLIEQHGKDVSEVSNNLVMTLHYKIIMTPQMVNPYYQ